MRIALVAGLVLAISLVLYLSIDLTALSLWVMEKQRAFQNQMAMAVQALRAGDAGAYLALFAATGAYGFVHALGPGHGKYVVGGVGLGTSVSAAKLTSLAMVSSILQAVWAIILVYLGFALIEVSAQQLTFLAEDVLAPASYAAIGLVGLILAYRGVKAMLKQKKKASAHHHHHHNHSHHDHVHDDDCGCGHSHGPTPDEVAKVGSIKEAIVLVTSIAIRPCTGAIFLLIIAWQMDIKLAGALAVIVMGLGTAALTCLVAISSIAARRMTLVSADASSVVFPAAQIFAGALICWISIGLLMVAL